MSDLTQERLKELLSYDPDTGVFRWRVFVYSGNKAVRVSPGDIAGYRKRGDYSTIRLDKWLYPAHRLAWLYVHGYFPENSIDHINGVRHDNRLINLREASVVCNAQNCKINKRNKSGFPGVSWGKRAKKWGSYLRLHNSTKNLGLYPTALEAALARFTAEVCDPRFTCNRRSELAKAIKVAWPEFRGYDRAS